VRSEEGKWEVEFNARSRDMRGVGDSRGGVVRRDENEERR